jgi:Holliday junction resolvasome RuvABC endonuclease subunit
MSISYKQDGRIRTFPDPLEVMPFPIVLAIDPSMNNLGWAVYNANLGQNRYDIDSDAWRFGLIHPNSKMSGHYKWYDAFARIESALDGWKPTHLACEWPEFFASVRGKIAATKGYTVDLAGLVGFIVGRFNLPMEFVTLWKPQQWKGMVPKGVTQAKFLRLFGDKEAGHVVRHYSDDVIDAIMIAEFWLTLYHREKFSWIQKWKLTRVK